MLSACWMGKKGGGGALGWMRRLVEVVMGGGTVVEGEEAHAQHISSAHYICCV